MQGVDAGNNPAQHPDCNILTSESNLIYFALMRLNLAPSRNMGKFRPSQCQIATTATIEEIDY